MNKERLLQLADVIEKGHHKFNGIHAAFNMSGWMDTPTNMEDDEILDFFREVNIPNREDIPKHECNTTACIAGFACLLWDYDEAKKDKPDYGYSFKARMYLDLTEYQAETLFCTYTTEDVTGAEAARVIRNFVETGRIEWYRLVMQKRGDEGIDNFD